MNNKSNKSKPTHLYASISIAVVLFLIGIFFIVFIHTQDLGNLLKEKVNVVVEMKENADGRAVLEKLRSNQQVVLASINHISKEDGLAFMTGGSDVDFGGENPLRDLIVFNVKSTYYSDENLEKVKQVLLAEEEVSAVFYENMVLENIKANVNKFALVILILGLVFIFLAVIIIRNTINLSMYADRDEIQTLQRIGAKSRFIKMPYIKSSVLIGMKGWLMAVVLIVIILIGISVNFPNLWNSLNILYVLLSVAILAIVAVMIPAWVSNSAANSFFKS